MRPKPSSWFHRGVKAFAHARPDAPRCYPCPICLQPFPSANKLTPDHVPPEVLGGRRLVLTCSDCNSRAGAKLEHEMQALEKTYDFACGTLERPMRSRLTIGGGTLNVETLATEGSIQIFGLPANNSPDAQQHMLEEMERLTHPGAWQGSQFQISNLGYRHRHAAVGWLRAGYLAAFAKLGYGYVMRPQLNIVRAQIAEPERRLLKGFMLTNLQLPKGDNLVVIVERPEWLKHSLAVRMGRHIVFLPGLDRRVNVYRRLAQHASTNSSLEVSGRMLPWPSGPEFSLDLVT